MWRNLPINSNYFTKIYLLFSVTLIINISFFSTQITVTNTSFAVHWRESRLRIRMYEYNLTYARCSNDVISGSFGQFRAPKTWFRAGHFGHARNPARNLDARNLAHPGSHPLLSLGVWNVNGKHRKGVLIVGSQLSGSHYSCTQWRLISRARRKSFLTFLFKVVTATCLVILNINRYNKKNLN